MSVNTNPGALIALQNLNATNRSLEETQNRINTGYKVNGYKDNAASFAIAQNLRSDLSGLNAVKSSLDNATSILDVTLAAGEAVSDVLNQMKEKALAAADPSLDEDSRTALKSDFDALKDQISTIIDNATFNGTNIIDAAGNSNGTTVSALVSAEVTSAGGTETIDVEGTDLTVSVVGRFSSVSFTTATNAASAASAVDSAIDALNSAMTSIGTGAKAVSAQRVFTDKLSDAVEAGIGNLVDADMAKESARLQALQVKQQLGMQALSIANQAPSVVLSLFR